MNGRMLLAGALIAVAAFSLGSVLAQEGGDAPAGGMQMPPWMQLGKEHEALKASVGEYDIAGEYFMAPGAPGEAFTATAKREMILDGRFLQETVKSEMMGMPWEGRLIEGYDTVRKKYWNVWLDSMTPVPNVAWGTMEDGVLTYLGESPNPMTGQLQKVRTTVTVQSETQATMDMYEVKEEGEDFLMMRLVYTKKQ